jgi:tetratricopeptide (TPR) repeat protein
LQDNRTDSAAILAAMAGKQQKFLEDILAAQLLAQQEPDLRLILTRGLIFELPVPLVALQAICEGIEGFVGEASPLENRHLGRARSVGLLEVSLNGAVRVPRVLGLAVAENGAELAAVGVKVLDREWIETAESSSEEQSIELYRLALVASDGEIAVRMANRLSDHWIYTSRFREALILCQNALALQSDSKIIYNLARIYETLGDWEKSLEFAQQSLTIQRKIGNRQGEAASLHQIAIIYENQGKWPEALQSCTDSLTIQREIGNRQEEAASLHQIANIYTNQGKWTEALQSCDDSLTIDREIGNRQGEAASLHQIAIIYKNQGKWTEALQSCADALSIDREIGDLQGEAASLNQMAYIAGEQGDISQQEQLCVESAQVLGEIGDYSNLITVLRNLGVTVEAQALTCFAQSLWLTLRLTTNLQSTIELIEAINNLVPTGDPLEALLGAVALYFCQDSPHPDLVQLQERSLRILDFAAEQGKMTQAQFDEWIVQNRLDDPNYYLPALDARLVEIIGDDWLFDPRRVSER